MHKYPNISLKLKQVMENEGDNKLRLLHKEKESTFTIAKKCKEIFREFKSWNVFLKCYTILDEDKKIKIVIELPKEHQSIKTQIETKYKEFNDFICFKEKISNTIINLQ